MVKSFPSIHEATVETLDGQFLFARQAASCLLAPAIGDKVLVHTQGGSSYILSILERNAEFGAELTVPGAREITLSSAKSLKLKAPQLGISSKAIHLVTDSLHQIGNFFTNNFKKIIESSEDKTISSGIITTSAETRTSVIRDVESLKTRMLSQEIESVATQNSEISLITAKRDVRLDAERVSIG
ncbi:DUF3540 domain-containing protein [uncultured Cohaesibacter sp.]|uniref:DUF3540 domain-containing protein n=1 Tax=uncultured Cohaesibacter sp. TaxID=1002546 RepID=UPI0029C805DB|nr:DUF3540 domain-containing protein [uncultured Cohaesibacter sp.]